MSDFMVKRCYYLHPSDLALSTHALVKSSPFALSHNVKRSSFEVQTCHVAF
ncbi:unnamed protein product, partial [Arabidopsis halleri]